MDISKYLPSTQFIVIVGSIALSGGLVVAADRLTNSPYAPPAQITSGVPVQNPADTNWQDTLRAIQGQSQAPSLTPPSANIVGSLLDAAQSTNLTTTVGRSLLINISAAKSQGLGSDIPTQNQLVAQARAQIESAREVQQYTGDDLTLALQNSDTLKAYGNAVMAIVAAHPKANYEDTVLTVGRAADSGLATHLSLLPGIQSEYRALLQGLLSVPVPPNLAPLHLKVVNDFALIVATYDDMALVLEDPLRGLAGLDIYDSTTDELERVFINIGQAFAQNGILFSKDEPGSVWSKLSPL